MHLLQFFVMQKSTRVVYDYKSSQKKKKSTRSTAEEPMRIFSKGRYETHKKSLTGGRRRMNCCSKSKKVSDPPSFFLGTALALILRKWFLNGSK